MNETGDQRVIISKRRMDATKTPTISHHCGSVIESNTSRQTKLKIISTYLFDIGYSERAVLPCLVGLVMQTAQITCPAVILIV